jgi:osmotically-inducible protein OsmY
MYNHWLRAAWSALLLMGVTGDGPARADAPAFADRSLNEVVVTAKRQSDPVADARLQRAVENTLAADAYINSDHITVTVMNGVATLHGIVFEDWDLRNAIRISRRIPGVRRVVNDLEIKLGGE